MADKFELDGFTVSAANVCTANGGFVGDMTGNVNGYVIFPSSDPLVAGAWWDNEGTLTKSSG